MPNYLESTPEPPQELAIDVCSQQLAQKILTRVGGHWEIFIVVIENFMEKAPSLISQLEESVRQQDIPAIQAALHKLKNIMAYIAFEEPVFNHLTEIERWCDKALHTPELAHSKIQSRFDAIKPELGLLMVAVHAMHSS